MKTQILILLFLLGGFKLSTSERNGTQSVCTICKCSSSKKDSNLIDIDCSSNGFSNDNLPVFPSNTLSLSLQRNKLTRLRRKYFQNLPKLQKLDVSGNPITMIDKDAFYDLKEHLLILNIKMYNIEDTSSYFSQIFYLTNLQELTILYRGTLIDDFRNLTKLTKIDFSNSPGIEFNAAALWPLQYLPLVSVNMRDSGVARYRRGTLNILFPKLQTLDVSINTGMGPFFADLISDIKSMNVSTLYANHIADIHWINITETMILDINSSKLENIHMVGNPLIMKKIPEQHLKKLHTLSYGDKLKTNIGRTQPIPTTPDICTNGFIYRFFGANRLIIKKERTIDGRTDYTALTEKYGQDTRMKVNMYEYIHRLNSSKQSCKSDLRNQQLNIIHCVESDIDHIQVDGIRLYILKEAVNVEYILDKWPLRRILAEIHKMQYNVCIYFPTLRRLDVFNMSGKYFLFKIIGLQYVEHMRLENCDFKQINDNFMSSFENLITLSLSHNDIGDMLNDAGYDDISSIALNSLPKLEVLDLSWNRIERLPIKLLSKQSKLKTFIMQHNKLRTLDIDMKFMSSLNLLDLSHNTLKEITSENMANLDQRPIVTVLLKGNILQCSCDYDNFLNWLKITSVNIPDKDNITCGSAISFKYVSKWVSKTCHDSVELSIVYILLGTVGPLFIIAVCICLKFNNRLKYRFHLLKWRITTCRNIPNGFAHINNNSVFISYSHGDRDWIWETLKLELESMEYNPFIHEIDFEIGQYIADNIVNAIHRCSKTIIILSDNFFESKWCMFELQMALVKGIDCIVPIQLSELTKKNKTLLLRYLSRTHVYGEWPPNDVELQKNFWKHLKTALDRAAPISEQAGFIENEANDTDEEDSV